MKRTFTPMALLLSGVRTSLIGLGLALAVVAGGDDTDLAKKLQGREPQAMELVYDRYGRVVYSVIFAIVRDTGVAEDLVQETFLRVWNRAHLLDTERGTLGTWLLTIARNRAIDHLRSSGARLSRSASPLTAEDHPAVFCSAERDILSRELLSSVQGAYDRLTPAQKQLIQLAYFEGLSQSEMAERLNQPLGTVKTWMRSALASLRERMRP